MIAYCDYIVTLIKRTLLANDDSKMLDVIGHIVYDLGDYGQFLSTKKTLTVTDMNGKAYQITVEEVV